ncbi:MAG TPA: acyl carrier protein [Actinomyces sp.]|nr:acyl carrier protein [Actinomyces sp.]
MGISIAEMLGMELPDEPADSDQPESDSADTGVAGSADEAQSSDQEDSDPVEEAVVAAPLAESTVPAVDFRPDLTLAGDFDLDKIGLYAVVASIEQDLKITLKDADIDSASTLADLMELVKQNHR